MSFTAADVLLEVREEVQDSLELNAEYRYSDSFLLRKMDLALRHMVVVRPDLFVATGTVICAAGSQQSGPTDSVRIMDVLRNQSGAALKEVNQEALDLLTPVWPTAATGAATNWMRYPRSPNEFFVYPPAQFGDNITISYARCVPVLSTATTIPLQDAYLSTLVFGTVWLVEAIDAEHVESGRAKMFQDAFNTGMAAGLATRQITDEASGGVQKAK